MARVLTDAETYLLEGLVHGRRWGERPGGRRLMHRRPRPPGRGSWVCASLEGQADVATAPVSKTA